MRRRTLALIMIPLVAVAAAVLLFILLRPTPMDVDALVARLDRAIAGGYLSMARDELRALRGLPSGEADLLRILRRGLTLGAASGDYAPLWAVASAALGKRPGSARIRAAAAYAGMRTGRLAMAEKVLARGPLPQEVADLLRGEAALRRGASWDGADGFTKDMFTLQKSSDPDAFEAAALRAGDPRISLDAALMAMGEGKGGRALLIVRSDLGDPRWDEPAAAILYDAGDSAGALARLQGRNDAKRGGAPMAFQMADMLQSLGRTSEAEEMLVRGLAAEPDSSWIPWVDLAFFASERGDQALALRRITEGLGRLPGNRELSVALARATAASGDTAGAVGILTTLLNEYPADLDGSLLLLDLQAPTMSPEAYRARLWKLYNVNTGDAAVLSALTEALIAVQDWQGVSIALRQNEAVAGTLDGDLLLVKGMAAAMQGDDAGALAFFQRAAEIRRDGIARYDIALVLLKKGGTRGALASLEAAIDEHRRSGAPGTQKAFLARVMQLRGQALMLDGSIAAARTALQQALALDPGNLRTSLLLGKLEAPAQ